MIPIDLEALISNLILNLFYNYFCCIARACNGYMETADIALNLDIADIVKQKPSK